jgi:hypothetical protein
VTTAAVPMAAVVTVVGGNCDNSDNGSGIDGGSDDGGCSDSECDSGSSGDGDSNGTGKPTKTTAATAMAVGGNTSIN